MGRKTQDEGIFDSDQKLLRIHAKRICEHLPRTSAAINSYLSAVNRLDNKNAELAEEVDNLSYDLKNVAEEREDLKQLVVKLEEEQNESRKFTDELASEIRMLKLKLRQHESVTDTIAARMRSFVHMCDALRAVDADEEPWPNHWPLEQPTDEHMMDTDEDADRYRRAFAKEPLADYPLEDCVQVGSATRTGRFGDGAKSNAPKEEIRSGRGELAHQKYKVRMIVKYDLPYEIMAPSSNAAMNRAEADAYEEHPDASDISMASVHEVD